MKKKSLLFPFILLGLALVGCSSNTGSSNSGSNVRPTTPAIVSSSVVSLSVQSVNKQFKVGDRVSENDLTIVGRLADGSTTIISGVGVKLYQNGTEVSTFTTSGRYEFRLTYNQGGTIISGSYQYDFNAVKTLTGISSSVSQLNCKHNETLDYSGVVITANYNDGTRQNVTANVSFSTVDTTSCGKKTLVVTYQGKTCQIDVNVYKYVTALTVTGDMVEVNLNETPDYSGLVFSAKYSDGTVEDVSSKVTIPNINTSTPGRVSVTVMYDDALCNVTVEVLSKAVQRIYPSKTSIDAFQNGTIDYSQIKIMAVYDDGTEGDVSSVVSFSSVSTATIGLQTVVATYKGLTCNFNVNVKKAPQALEVSSNTITVGKNGTPDFTGLTFNLVYSDGTKEDVTSSITFPSVDTSTVGTKQVSVTYLDKSITLTVEVIDVLVSNLRTNIDKIGGFINQSLDTSLLKVTAVYPDGTTEDVTNQVTYSTVDLTSTGDKSLVISFGGVSTTIKAKIVDPAGGLTGYVTTVETQDLTYDVSQAVDYSSIKLCYYEGGTYFALPSSDFRFEIVDDNSNAYVSGTTGKYSLVVTYTGSLAINSKTTVLNISFSKEVYHTVNIYVSGLMYDPWWVDIPLTGEVDYLSYAKTIPGYFFVGYSDYLLDVKEFEIVKAYYIENETGKVTVSYVGAEYETAAWYTVNNGQTVTYSGSPRCSTPERIGIFNNPTALADSNKYVVASKVEFNERSVPYIKYIDSTKMEVSYLPPYIDPVCIMSDTPSYSFETTIPSDGKYTPYGYIVYKQNNVAYGVIGDKKEHKLVASSALTATATLAYESNALKLNITLPSGVLLDDIRFDVAGTSVTYTKEDFNLVQTTTGYEGIINNAPQEGYILNGYYILFSGGLNYISNLNGIYSPVASSLNNVNYTNIAENSTIAGNCAEISITEILNNTPDGMILGAFELVDDNNNVVETVEYEDGMSSVYFTGLTSSTDYTLVGCYRNAIAARYVAGNGLTYPYRFVGYRFLTGSTNVRQVKIMYEGHLLYTFYVAYGQPIIGYHDRFGLPLEYSDYFYAGVDADVSKGITEDTVLNAILVKRLDGDYVAAVFLDFYGNVLKTERVLRGSDATPPSYDYTYEDEFKKYTFTSFEQTYLKMSDTKYIRPQFKYEYKLEEPIPYATAKVDNGVLLVSIGLKNSAYSSVFDYYYELIDSSNYKEIHKNFERVNVLRGETYQIIAHISYNMGGEDKDKQISLSIYVPKEDEIPNYKVDKISSTYAIISVYDGFNRTYVYPQRDSYNDYICCDKEQDSDRVITYLVPGIDNNIRFSKVERIDTYTSIETVYDFVDCLKPDDLPKDEVYKFEYTEVMSGENIIGIDCTITGKEISGLLELIEVSYFIPELGDNYPQIPGEIPIIRPVTQIVHRGFNESNPDVISFRVDFFFSYDIIDISLRYTPRFYGIFEMYDIQIRDLGLPVSEKDEHILKFNDYYSIDIGPNNVFSGENYPKLDNINVYCYTRFVKTLVDKSDIVNIEYYSPVDKVEKPTVDGLYRIFVYIKDDKDAIFRMSSDYFLYENSNKTSIVLDASRFSTRYTNYSIVSINSIIVDGYELIGGNILDSNGNIVCPYTLAHDYMYAAVDLTTNKYYAQLIYKNGIGDIEKTCLIPIVTYGTEARAALVEIESNYPQFNDISFHEEGSRLYYSNSSIDREYVLLGIETPTSIVYDHMKIKKYYYKKGDPLVPVVYRHGDGSIAYIDYVKRGSTYTSNYSISDEIRDGVKYVYEGYVGIPSVIVNPVFLDPKYTSSSVS